MRAVIYTRVSTDEQDVSMQVKAIKDYCNRENLTIVHEYADIGFSGKKESRPEFDQMLNDMRKGLFDCLIVYKLDRIGRSTRHLLMLFEEFDKKNIKVISVTQNFNTNSSEGRLMLRMLMILAEYERELIVSRVNDGLKEALANGKKLGRPFGSQDKGRRRTNGYLLMWQKRKTKFNDIYST